MANELVRLLERDDAGRSVLALYFDLDEGAMVERDGQDDLYSLKIVVLYPSDDEHLHEPKAKKVAKDIGKLFADRTRKDNIGARKWIELSGVIATSDRQLSVRNARLLKEWVCTAEESIDARARHIRSKLAEADRQLKHSSRGIVRVGMNMERDGPAASLTRSRNFDVVKGFVTGSNTRDIFFALLPSENYRNERVVNLRDDRSFWRRAH